MSVTLIQADARSIPLADSSVDLVVTSPPYFGLRSYTDNGEHYKGQVGDEATPAEFIDALIECTREMVRVLKPSGSIWVNLGDRYSDGTPLDNELTVGDAGWLAGLIDADGTITVRRTQQKQMRAPTFEGIISVEQMDRDAVDRCKTTTGLGKVHEVNGSRGRTMYRWTVSTQQARWVAERIWPFLRIKHRQAKAIVELGKHREQCQARGRHTPIKPEWVEYRQLICDAVRAWNRREPHEWEPPALPVVELPLRPHFLPAKSLAGVPWRYAIRCIDELGLILRAEVIWCLSGGAKVYARTSTGDRPVMLRDLVRSYRPEDVQLWNGEKWTQVLGWSKTPDDDGALELELRTGERIGCTPGHQWPTQRGVIRADEVHVGDVIETTRLPEPEQPSSPTFLPDRDIGWLVGLYIAEGSRSERMVQIAGHVDESARHERLAAIAKALDGKCNVYQTSDNVSTCNLSGSVILGVIDRYVSNGTAKTKRLRFSAWQRSDAFLAAVVEGYLSGDGHHDVKNDRWRLGFCANDEWAADLRTLAARLGAKISLRRTQHVGSYGTFPGWRGEWRWTRSAHHNAKHDGEVVAIRKSRARDFYDLGVADEPHLFALASGVLTHNSKPNGLPESVTDRVRRSHETWFHLTKEPRYYSSVDAIREPHIYAVAGQRRNGPGGRPNDAAGRPGADGSQHTDGHPLGKLPGSVWTVPTEPLKVPDDLGVDHFAAFPTEWPRRIIQGWSPRGVCVECGEGRRPVVDRERMNTRPLVDGHALHGAHEGDDRRVFSRAETTATITGEACACPEPTAPTTPGVVLDPFGGTGTTALCADVLGRHGISVDMSADYLRIAQWRTTDPKQRASAAQRPYVAPVEVPAGQSSLLDLIEDGEPA